MKVRIPLFGALWLVSLAGSWSETVKDREGAVRDDRAAMEQNSRWIYNDWQKGFEEAKRTGKPLMVVLRCVPCKACAGIDAQVLSETDITSLMDQFVCVRVMNANALDLELFQFDYDLSFSTLFFNGDGTVYGRYGSWRQQKDPLDQTTAGYRLAMEGALALHKGYPANRTALSGKQGGPVPYKTPVDIPGLKDKYTNELDWNANVVQSCVHCHQIGDAFRSTFRDNGKPIPTELIYPWPAPETVGLVLAPDQVARVESVDADSPAAKAGLQAGDDLVSVAGQPLLAVADVSWALHHAPDEGSLPLQIKRGNAMKTLTLALPKDWRRKADISRRVGTWPMRGMASGGLLLEDLGDTERTSRSIDPKAMALRVKGVGQYGKHAAAKKAGFQKDDVIVEIAGRSNRMSEGELIGHILQDHRAGEKVKATVLRGTEKVSLTLPIQ
ncbi:MAG: Trx7/PDZ domain-containing (seleno)protein [Terrimicrobiaceae bacterium]